MKKDILITVKTYPNPSLKYLEVVCTAGITSEGSWIRLYPLPFRYLPHRSQFSKYQWIGAKVQKHDRRRDGRAESFRVDPDSIELGAFLNTNAKGGWEERKRIVLPTASRSLEELEQAYVANHTSLGIFKPLRIKDFIIEKDQNGWAPSKNLAIRQGRLFGPQPKNLEKVPWKFSYVFECDEARCKGHTLSIHDWEIYALYRNLKKRHGDFAIDRILGDIKKRWFDKMCAKDKDTYLIVGTVYPKPTFIVLGVFWPPK